MNVFSKKVLPHAEFYISVFTKASKRPYLLFIHGGPGFNSGVIENLIENYSLFNSLNYNIILYDQRTCGRSMASPKIVLHQDNVDDLQKIIEEIKMTHNINIQCLIGHSYGAKILFDFYKKFSSTIPGIFVSTASSILTPRLNNLMLDLAYLKRQQPNLYVDIFKKIKALDYQKIWALSEKLDPLFQKNTDRPFFYWANLGSLRIVQYIQKKINLPINTSTFSSVRKDLYSKQANFSVDIDTLPIKKLWINGFHDFIMNGQELTLSSAKIHFYKSSHYPHIEENDAFCEIVNEFIYSS